MKKLKICPVLGISNPVHMAKCREKGCAWWDDQAASCCVVQQKKSLPGATDTEQAEGGTQSLPDTDSTSHYT